VPEAVSDIQRATRAHYDRWSYDFETAEHAAMQLEESLLGRALAAVPAGGIVLDAGCGTGLVSRLARRQTRARGVVGVDLSRGSLARAHAASSGVAFAQGDLLRLPVRTGAVDLVVSRGVIMTTGAPERAFAELARATRPGGRLYVRVYNRRNVYRWIYQLGGPVCRAIAAVPGGTALLALLVVPPFYLALQAAILVLRGRFARISPRVLWNVFADQLLVPWNSFHTSEELRRWGADAGCRPIGEGTITLGQQIEALFEKP
jgi:SAM-dependent methyltransferase